MALAVLATRCSPIEYSYGVPLSPLLVRYINFSSLKLYKLTFVLKELFIFSDGCFSSHSRRYRIGRGLGGWRLRQGFCHVLLGEWAVARG